MKEPISKLDKSNVSLVRTNSHCKGELVVHIQQKSPWLYPYFYPCPTVQCCNQSDVEIKECSFSFTIKSEVCTCLMNTLKKTEYNSICTVFTEVFLIARIPNSIVRIHFHQREKAILWPSWKVVWPPGPVS